MSRPIFSAAGLAGGSILLLRITVFIPDFQFPPLIQVKKDSSFLALEFALLEGQPINHPNLSVFCVDASDIKSHGDTNISVFIY